MDSDLILSLLIRTAAAGTPLLLGVLGSLLIEKAGVLNLGVEGVMAVGALAGFAAAQSTANPWLGLIAAPLAGLVFMALYGGAVLHLRANQTVAGLALAMLGTGLAGLWGKPFIGQALSVKLPRFADERLDLFFPLALVAAGLLWAGLSRTRTGLALRTVGENPRAGEAQGLNVLGLRWLALLVGGALIALAGASLSLSYAGSWSENVTGGRGWIVVALTIFALWSPLRALFAAGLFGGIFVLQYILQPFGIPASLLATLPYAATLIVLVVDGLTRSHRAQGAPAALGEPFRKEER